jgi:hypothetical protein
VQNIVVKEMMRKIVTDRRFIFFGLLILLILMSFYFESNYQKHLENPTTAIILKSYPLGETVAVSGVVKEVHDGGFSVSGMYHGFDVSYTIVSDEKVSPGDQAEVLGVLEPANHVNAAKVLVVPSFDYSFMLFRSAIVGLIFIVFFLYYWSFDLKKLEFRRRR